jgi:hypothetical protein
MTIKQQGGIFGRNPTFNDVNATDITTTNLDATDIDVTNIDTGTLHVATNIELTPASSTFGTAPAITHYTNGYVYMTGGASGLILRDDGGAVGIQIQNDDYIKFETGNPAAEAARFNSSGNLAFPSGQGIDFSATSGTGTSELFDDYEEGTWTPVLSDATSGGNTATLGSSTAHYVKVGSVVHLFLQVININNSGMTGGNTLYIQGLPYTSVSSNNSAGSVVFDRVSVSGFFAVTPAIGPTRDYMTLGTTTTGAADGSLTVAAFNNSSSDIQNLHISYRA